MSICLFYNRTINCADSEPATASSRNMYCSPRHRVAFKSSFNSSLVRGILGSPRAYCPHHFGNGKYSELLNQLEYVSKSPAYLPGRPLHRRTERGQRKGSSHRHVQSVKVIHQRRSCRRFRTKNSFLKPSSHRAKSSSIPHTDSHRASPICSSVDATVQ